MRINENVRNEPSEDFSAFFNAFSKQFNSILDSRPIQDDTYKNYITVDKSEKALRRFIDRTDKGIALFKGGQGTGKSSTLYQIHRQYRSKITTRSLLVDLRQHGSKIPESISRIKDFDDRVNACIPKLRELLSARFQSACRSIIEEEKLNDDDVTWSIFCYCLRYHLHVIPVSLREKIVSDGNIDNIHLALVRKMLTKDYSFHDSFYFLKYIYLLVKTSKVRKFVCIIDNGDQLPYEMLEAAIFCANHYSGCLNSAKPRSKRNKNVIIGKVKVNFIIACRHHNYEKLVERSNVNALGSHSHVPISHSGLPSLGKIVNKRISTQSKYGTYTFKRGIRLSEVDAKKCIKAYFRQLETSGCYQQIMLIHNNNLADTFDCIKSITQNRFFPKYDDFIKEFRLKGRNTKKSFVIPINVLTMLRCLLWGNPDNITKSIYPPIPCDLPNLFSWDGINIFSFLSEMRVIQILLKMGVRADGGRMTSTRSVFDLYRQSIEISEEEFSSIIAKMARRRLVFSYAERQILSINDYDSIKLSWRAEYIFKNMKRYAPIGQAYLEDLEIADGDEENIDVKSGYSVRYQNDEAILSLINYCFEIELAQLEIIKENNSLDSYRSIYPAKPISDNIYLPLRKELKGVSETLAVQFSETRSSVREILGKSEGIAGLKKHEMSKLAFPRRLERGVQIVVDNVSDEERRRLYLELIKEAMETLSSGDGRKKSTVAKLKQKLSDLVKVGRDGEKVTEWGQELLEAFEPLIAAAPT